MFIALSSAVLALTLQAQPSTELRRDAGGRPVISAQLNGKGPFDMVLDTAAQTSLLSPALATELGLKPLEEKMAINGAVGNVAASVYPVDRFTTDLFEADHVGMLSLPNAQTTSARGIVGIERFAKSKLLFDRLAGRLTVVPSGPAPAGYVTVAGQVYGGLVTIPLVVNGVTIQALVDTGAGPTVANFQALKALGWANDDPRLKAAGAVRGAGMGMAAAKIGVMDSVKLGPITLGNLPIVFADLAAGRDAPPSIMLGSNVLNLLEAYAVDFPRGELQIRVPAKTAPAK